MSSDQLAEGRLNLQMSRMLCSWPSDGDPCSISRDTVAVMGSEKGCHIEKGATEGRARIRRGLGLF